MSSSLSDLTTSRDPAWKRAAASCIAQHPLLRTCASHAGLAHLRSQPRVITLGIGLASQRTLSRGLPFDVLGMLLPAEQLRRAVGAERVIALIADRHALSNGFSPHAVRMRAGEIHEGLTAIRTALGLPLEIIRAETLHRDPDYARLHGAVRERAPDAHPYVTLEVADTELLRLRYGSVIKLGWALADGPCDNALDERYFDDRFRRWVGSDVGFVYCEAGRTLDPARLKTAPYLVFDPSRRVLLSPDEAVEHKLQRAATSTHAERAVMAHLRRITQAYSRSIAPLTGPLAVRMQTVLRHIFAPRPSLAIDRSCA